MAVKITAPVVGSTVEGIVRVTVEAPGIKQINFYIDGVLKGRDKQSPFTFDWYTTRYSDGSHEIKAVSSNGKYSDRVNVSVKNQKPVSLTVVVTGNTQVGDTLTATLKAA